MRQTIRAFQLGVAPTIYNVCFARHAKEMWTSGLYFITERYQTDFDDAIQDEETREMLLSNDGSLIDDIGQQTMKHLESMANDDMLVYDLKPSNIVLKSTETITLIQRSLITGGTFVSGSVMNVMPSCVLPYWMD